MIPKVILDGTLFSENQILYSNRNGMNRVAEDITENLIKNKELEISFTDTSGTSQYQQALQQFTNKNYPSHINRVLPKKPLQNIPKVRVVASRFYDSISAQLLPGVLDKNDVFHSFYYPFSAAVQNKKIKKTITLLDIISLRLDGYTPELIDLTKKIIDCIIPNFAISISEFSKHDLVDYDKRIDPERIFVVPLAASKKIFFKNTNKDAWQLVKNKYALPDKYFLTISSSDPRKNIPHLVKSFSKFILQQKRADIFLVLAGNTTHSLSMLDELNIDKRVRDKIFIPAKHIDTEDLAVIYSNALCFFFMSLYEGFGLPVLEAMQCGTPVITSNATSLPEVVGDAGIMLPANDEDALCEQMNNMYSNNDVREKYAQAGLERSQNFSWERCANEYVKIFKKIAADA